MPLRARKGTIDYNANPDYANNAGFEFTAPEGSGGNVELIEVVTHGYKAHKVTGERQPEPPLQIEPTIVNDNTIRVRICDAAGNEYGGANWSGMAAHIDYTLIMTK